MAEVLVDRLTGSVKVTRVDILMDIGRSINPAVDRGQVVGGFVQGLGWATTEELRYSDAGELLTCSPSNYKIPAVTDIPPDFRVAFLDRDNPGNVYGSKAVGEPPFVLGHRRLGRRSRTPSGPARRDGAPASACRPPARRSCGTSRMEAICERATTGINESGL